MAIGKQRTAVRREQIAQAALALAADHGLEQVSIGALARRVGLTPSAMYRHFKNKAEILEAVLELLRARLLRNVELVRAANPEPAVQLQDLLFRHLQLVRENQGMPRIILSEAMGPNVPERRGRILAGMTDYLAGVAGIIRDGQKQGVFSEEVSPETAAVLFLGLIIPPVILWHASSGAFDATRQAQAAWPLFLGALQGNTGKETRSNNRRKTS